MIIPSIDLMDGKAVKLIQGKKKAYEKDALELAKEFSIYPRINLIDLDAAFGKGNNLKLIEQICKICNCNVGGGIRTIEKAYELLKIGAKKIIIGTNANKEFLRQLPKEKTIVAVDSKKGKVVDKGWTNATNYTPFERVIELENYCSGFLYTYVDKEGMMGDIDSKSVLKLRQLTKNKIMYAGGVSDKEQILELQKYDIDAVVGMGFFKKKIDISRTFTECIDFSKGLVPTIVKDSFGNILMLAYSSKDSLYQALKDRSGIYYSRSRKKIWKKGETSGNYQTLLKIETDCDFDTLIFTVDQNNVACHNGDYSCFENKEFSFEKLEKIIKDRKETGSFTGKILKDRKELNLKILEEAKEVISFKDKNNLRWEIADLIYFLSVLMVKEDISFKDIKNELKTRDFMKTYIKTTKL